MNPQRSFAELVQLTHQVSRNPKSRQDGSEHQDWQICRRLYGGRVPLYPDRVRVPVLAADRRPAGESQVSQSGPLGALPERLPGHPPVLRHSLLRLHVDLRGRVLHPARLHPPRILRSGSVLLHLMLHPPPPGNPHDAPLPGLLQGQRPLHHAAADERHDHGRRSHLRPDCRPNVRMLRGQPRLDAQLGAQRHGVGIRARGCRRVCTIPGRDPVHCGSATGHVPPAEQHCQRRDGRVHHGRAEVPRRAHRYLSGGERVIFCRF